MSMNKFMHPRNIYQVPPDFKELAATYPEFKQHVTLNITGKVVFDFKNPDALRALSRTLLKRDFNLDVEIPKDRLIPTIPLRLNYILWIEDLLDYIGREKKIKGVDIGTGASCIYPLLAAQKNQWSMIATELDEDSVTYARSNVARNNLTELIEIVQNSGDTLLTHVVTRKKYIDFCMCNPPFFSSTEELHPFFKSRSKNRPHPKNAFVASSNEVVSKGGEVEFIQKLMTESKLLDDGILIYTTMVGHKSHLPILKKTLREIEVSSFHETQFCQGNTTRWGLAWTFVHCDLRKATNTIKLLRKYPKHKPPLTFKLPVNDVSPESVNRMLDIFFIIFRHLKMSVEEVTRNKNHRRYFVTASSNTWSFQRRERREHMRLTLAGYEIPEPDIIEHDEDISPGKRAVDDICENTSKKLKLGNDSTESSSEAFFKFMCAFKCDEQDLYLEMNTMDEFGSREYLHQIFQYIKNNMPEEPY